MSVRNKWVRRVQQKDRPDIQSPGWRLVEERDTGILKCEGRVTNYQPIYLGGGAFEDKLISHVHNQTMHLGVSNTMALFEKRGGFQSYVRK
jgi:hypothetical protein